MNSLSLLRLLRLLVICVCSSSNKQLRFRRIWFTIGAGHLASRPIGPRSPRLVRAGSFDRAAWIRWRWIFPRRGGKYHQVPYIWGRYDVLSLPPVPLRRDGNPCLTFLTPSLWPVIAVSSMSWLLRNRSLLDRKFSHRSQLAAFWLNERFHNVPGTQNPSPGVHGDNEPCVNSMQFKVWPDLKRPSNSSARTVRLPSSFPLDFHGPGRRFLLDSLRKGHTFLAFFWSSSKSSRLNPSSRDYISQFAYKSISSDDFRGLFTKHFPTPVGWNTWLNHPGHHLQSLLRSNPHDSPWDPCSTRFHWSDCCAILLWLLLVFHLNLDQKLVFLDLLSQRIATISRFQNPSWKCPTASRLFALVLLALPVSLPALPLPGSALAFITQHGRMKYNRPIYHEMYKLGGEFRNVPLKRTRLIGSLSSDRRRHDWKGSEIELNLN